MSVCVDDVAYSEIRRSMRLAIDIAVPIMTVVRSLELEAVRAASATMSNEKGSRFSVLARASSNLSVSMRLFRRVETVGLLKAEKSWKLDRKVWRMADSAWMHVLPPHEPKCLAHAAKAQMVAMMSMVVSPERKGSECPALLDKKNSHFWNFSA